MKFVCLGFFESDGTRSKQQRPTEPELADCASFDAELKRSGHYVAGEFLVPQPDGVTLRRVAGELEVSDGPHVETKEHLGGFLILEAVDLNQAIQIMSKHPGLSVGRFQIRTIDAEMQERQTRLMQELLDA